MHLTPRPRLPCPICKKKLLATSLKAHVEDIHRDTSQPFEHTCETCGRGFASKSKLATHERATHFKGKGIFNCDQCDELKPFQTVNRESLLHHQYYLHGILQEGAVLYSCDLCDFKTPVKFNLTRHGKRKHMELQMYPCPGEGCKSRFVIPTTSLMIWILQFSIPIHTLRHSYTLYSTS